ncbi:MAG: DUF624 domain-containing protein [Lachnospiraceae bacterium]|nr:DUF624 domain-containing protein [Lachnospiraceae bacterium]
MKDLFKYDKGIWKVFGIITDVLILNIIFMVTCIPIITIGAAKTALYSQTKKMIKGEEGYLVKDYFDQFKENFKASTKMWLIFLLASALPVIDIWACTIMDANFFVTFCMVFMLSTLIVFTMTIIYALALQSTFENSVKNTLKNGLLLSIGNFPISVIIVVVDLLPLLVFGFFPSMAGVAITAAIFVWGVVAGCINSFFFNKIFEKLINNNN